MRNVLDQAVEYLERVPGARATVAADQTKEALREKGGADGLPHELAERWAKHHKLVMTTNREDNRVLATTYYFKRA